MNTDNYLEADRADFGAYIDAQLRGWADPQRAEAERWLRQHPGMSARDWKGKGCDAPAPAEAHEAEWSSLDPIEVRERATTTVARLLTRSTRQAAGRDLSLIWNPLARKYRLRLAGEEGRDAPRQDGGDGGVAATAYGAAEGRGTGASEPEGGEKDNRAGS